MPFGENSPEFPRRRPDTYNQYKQERGADVRSGDLAHYFNSEIFSAGHQLEFLKLAIEQSAALNLEERKQMLELITKLRLKLNAAHIVANDTFQILGSKEQGQ